MNRNAMRNAATMQKASRMDNMNVNANVQSQPNMNRTDGELDYSYYDWQTNAAILTRTIVWPDGKINFAYTWSSDDSYSDRGTTIGTYDSNTDEWIPLGGRIESERTGFGTIARFKENGIVVAAHTSTECGIYIVDNKDNMTPNSVPCALRMSPTNDPAWPNVTTSGVNRDIIHVIATGSSDNLLYYFRSSDGGQSWDKENVILPYLTAEYGSDWGSNVAYWMETTASNRITLIVSNAWSDCMAIYSDDNGETWDRTVFFHHCGINTTIPEDAWMLYPRWTSAVWGMDNELQLAFEFNGTRGEPASGSYFPSVGGIGFWSENLPYVGPAGVAQYDPSNPLPPVPGQPFIMDSAYVMNDLYAAWPRWSDQTYDNPYLIGYVSPLDEQGQVESWDEATEFNIEDFGLHGAYNSGCAAMPTLCQFPNSPSELVAVWSAMDENNMNSETGNFYYKLFAAYSSDCGRTWSNQKHLTTDFMQTYTEHAYLQAAVVGNTLVVAVMTDGTPGTFVQEDDSEGGDNLYSGYTYDMFEVFGTDAVEEVVTTPAQMSIYPNPAVDQLNVTLSKSASISVYNIMGQTVMNVEGHAGANTLDISNLNSGIYFVSAGNNTQKFIVK